MALPLWADSEFGDVVSATSSNQRLNKQQSYDLADGILGKALPFENRQGIWDVNQESHAIALERVRLAKQSNSQRNRCLFLRRHSTESDAIES